MINPNVLPLEKVRNPRDIGGYVGYQGRKVKMHRLIRSGKISNITSKDKKFLLDYGLTKIIDLRSPLECHKMPDSQIPGVEHLDISIAEDDNTNGGKKDLDKVFATYRKDQYAGFKMMCDRYRSHVVKEHAQNSLHKILEVLANTKEGAILYHCSEGKDRTGIVTVMILYILGVDMETIRQDYLYSNYMLNTKEGAILYHCSEGKDRTGIVTVMILYILGVDMETIRQDYLYSNYMLDGYRAKRDRIIQEKGGNLCLRANMRILGSVSDAFLDTSLIAIEKEFGGLDNYLREKICLTLQ